MLDPRFEIRKMLSSTYGSLSEKEMAQIEHYINEYQSYFMPGQHRVPYTTDFGRVDEGRAYITEKSVDPEPEDLPEFSI